jgi:hypothetical protein
VFWGEGELDIGHEGVIGQCGVEGRVRGVGDPAQLDRLMRALQVCVGTVIVGLDTSGTSCGGAVDKF